MGKMPNYAIVDTLIITNVFEIVKCKVFLRVCKKIINDTAVINIKGVKKSLWLMLNR